MIIITNKQEPFISEYDPLYNENYNLNATISINEEADATEAVAAFVRSMQVEGYSNEPIARALHGYARFMSEEYRITLDDMSCKDSTDEKVSEATSDPDTVDSGTCGSKLTWVLDGVGKADHLWNR